MSLSAAFLTWEAYIETGKEAKSGQNYDQARVSWDTEDTRQQTKTVFQMDIKNKFEVI